MRASGLFRFPLETNRLKRVGRLSQRKEATHVAYLLDGDYCDGLDFFRDGASHTERQFGAWEVVSR